MATENKTSKKSNGHVSDAQREATKKRNDERRAAVHAENLDRHANNVSYMQEHGLTAPPVSRYVRKKDGSLLTTEDKKRDPIVRTSPKRASKVVRKHKRAEARRSVLAQIEQVSNAEA